jgi:hypothetical protein
MSNHAHLRPHNRHAARARRGAIPDAYAGKRPNWRTPRPPAQPNVRQQAKAAAVFARILRADRRAR